MGVPEEQRCASASTDALDVDVQAYQALTGEKYVSGQTPNLKVLVSVVDCPS